MGAYYCAICKQTTFEGKKHIFGKTHQSRIRVVLLKFIEKVKEARRTLKKPQVEKFDGCLHSQNFWCYCCDLEVERNVTDGDMTVLFGGLIEHLASPEHRKKTHKFWWDNKAEPKFRDKVIIKEEDSERFKAEVKKALGSFVEKEDEFIKQEAATIRAQEKHRQEVLEFLLEVCFPRMQWQYPSLCVTQSPTCSTESMAQTHLQKTPLGNAIKTCHISVLSISLSIDLSLFLRNSSQFTLQGLEQPSAGAFNHSALETQWAAAGQGLTFIGYQDSTNSGNVHTGAVPPWLQDDPLEGSSGAAAHPQIGPSLQDFLKQKEQEKLKKLPPNRVGANFDHSSHTDANWLPSFGRVWNSGRRWQSRHQFRQEEGQKHRQKRKKEHSAVGGKKAKTADES
ncbi:centrosomal AT-AC splicing factor isoform X2 [Nelusetta ayraudi]|uniref:centrosomal AT-AC splicing factor isoform X2 n=1 Tax=Nelusetta ayraudi TaxID=303726 RepID=UPI003F70B7BB